jgi:hypothetical protein
MTPLRLLVFDRTCRGPGLRRRLSSAWAAGSVLYRALRRVDASFAASGWEEALGWLTSYEPDRPVGEIQFWGHGRWGQVLMGKQALGRDALRAGHPLYGACVALRHRLAAGGEALLWLRTCEAFGAEAGHDFARALVDSFGCRVAGHTYTIGYWQSGLHSLVPGRAPDWPLDEGLAAGTPEMPARSLPSLPDAPHTIGCLVGQIPDGW